MMYPGSIRVAFLILGTACNMACRHCSQLPVREDSIYNDLCSEDLICALAEWSKQSEGKHVLWFWGGEPLLYMPAIKDVVRRLEARNAKLAYTTTTNGLLLTQELADYFNAHNFRVVMSYDAPNPVAVRQKVPSEDAIAAFLKIHNRTVNTVFSPANCDLCASVDYLSARFPGTHISIGFMQVMSAIPEDTYRYKPGSMLESMRNAAKRLNDGRDRDGIIQYWFKRRIKRWRMWDESVRKKWIESPIPPCGSGESTISFDLQGNCYPCHNGGMQVGTVSDGFDVLHKRTMQVWERMLPTGCLKCEHLDMCRNRCPMAMRKGDEYEQCSAFMKEYWLATKIVANEYELFM